MIYAIAKLKKESDTRRKRLRCTSDTTNLQFPVKTGFRLRWNPAAGSLLSCDQLVRVGIKKAN
jgi:hypothetical protein